MSRRQGHRQIETNWGGVRGARRAEASGKRGKREKGGKPATGAARGADKVGPGKRGEWGKNVLADSRCEAVGYVGEKFACPDRISKRRDPDKRFSPTAFYPSCCFTEATVSCTWHDG